MRGTVVKIARREGRDSQGKPWILYSFITADTDDGRESGWVLYGFEAPPFKEGDVIEYEITKNARGKVQYAKGTGKIIKKPNSPAVVPATPGVTGPSSGPITSPPPSSLDARHQSIVLQHSQEMAIQAVAVLLHSDALPTTGAKTKAGEAKRFDEIVAAIDKLTVKYFHDAVSGRLLSNVPDMGVINTAPDAPLPDAQPAAPSKQLSEY